MTKTARRRSRAALWRRSAACAECRCCTTDETSGRGRGRGRGRGGEEEAEKEEEEEGADEEVEEEEGEGAGEEVEETEDGKAWSICSVLALMIWSAFLALTRSKARSWLDGSSTHSTPKRSHVAYNRPLSICSKGRTTSTPLANRFVARIPLRPSKLLCLKRRVRNVSAWSFA